MFSVVAGLGKQLAVWIDWNGCPCSCVEYFNRWRSSWPWSWLSWWWTSHEPPPRRSCWRSCSLCSPLACYRSHRGPRVWSSPPSHAQTRTKHTVSRSAASWADISFPPGSPLWQVRRTSRTCRAHAPWASWASSPGTSWSPAAGLWSSREGPWWATKWSSASLPVASLTEDPGQSCLSPGPQEFSSYWRMLTSNRSQVKKTSMAWKAPVLQCGGKEEGDQWWWHRSSRWGPPGRFSVTPSPSCCGWQWRLALHSPFSCWGSPWTSQGVAVSTAGVHSNNKLGMIFLISYFQVLYMKNTKM